jgi:hypothetical protein
MRIWQINCMEAKYPGMWQRWFRNQSVAVGWRGDWGYPLAGPSDDAGWRRTRSALQKMEIGDCIVASLKGHRVGRLGQITGKAIEDTDWEPLVPCNPVQPEGEMGRRIFVRWDMTVGPEDRDLVVLLPQGTRFTGGELRPTISEIRSISYKRLVSATNDPANWQSLFAHFDYEKALSGYLATYPHHLEDGLTQHPSEKVRERTFGDRSRSDVILLDRQERSVIVECKQGQPTVGDIEQLRGYLRHLLKEKKVTAKAFSFTVELRIFGLTCNARRPRTLRLKSFNIDFKSNFRSAIDLFSFYFFQPVNEHNRSEALRWGGGPDNFRKFWNPKICQYEKTEKSRFPLIDPVVRKPGSAPTPLKCIGGGYSHTPRRWWSPEGERATAQPRPGSHPQPHPVTLMSAKPRRAAPSFPSSSAGEWHPVDSIGAPQGILARDALMVRITPPPPADTEPSQVYFEAYRGKDEISFATFRGSL